LNQRFFENPALMTPQMVAWQSPLAKGRIVIADLRTATDDLKRMLESIGTKSLLVVPVSVDGKYWGELGFEGCKSEREWPALEIEILQSLADLVGNAIRREQYVNEIANANRIVQSTPTILYRLRGEPSLPMIYVSQNIKLFGHEPAALIASPLLYQSLIHPDDRAAIRNLMARLLDKDSHRGVIEYRLLTGHGDYRWVENRYSVVRDDAGRLIEVEGLMIDITERKAAEEKIALLARTDPLTGLPNRATFIERLQNSFAAARRGATGFAVHYLDLDRFKDINDTLGHPLGDRLLITIGERLKSSIRETDVVARIGGDEFAVLQADLSDTLDAGTLAGKIRAALAEPIAIAGNELRITTSIGISIYAPDTAVPEDMLAQADVALYRAKEEGRDQYRFHTKELDVQVREQVAITDELRLALGRGEFELYYQPQVELSTNRIAGMEALIRWNHPKRGLLMPSAFIAVAERTGAIAAIGQWVLDRACQQMSSWRAAGIAPPTIAVNISPVQIKIGSEFVELVTETLAKWHLAPANLELDVTESMLARATLAQNDVLERLQKIGVKISIDDFGTKYSSLDYLKTYRVNRLKIPQPLIDSATRDPDSAAMVRAIVGIARELNIEVIAQGVETEAQWSFLTATSPVTKVQGFYYSEPVPADRAAQLLRRGRIAPAEDKRALLAVDLAPV
jgi:diguanylate cyclase (GGDEF)-like protein/PAS domain S-box-containing protein